VKTILLAGEGMEDTLTKSGAAKGNIGEQSPHHKTNVGKPPRENKRVLEERRLGSQKGGNAGAGIVPTHKCSLKADLGGTSKKTMGVRIRN